ncbi:hypothetical protein NDU88_001540 [Pleurodeles waltl]|uniref:Protein preY, mitochondrial n=1 Tax=Pleurodeles waltl TaxID=8319 RepID=A0AAV7W095_PLEWA|nr:hypothetical protein NDU88_001540 [Pleurodeles waltl]
MQGLGLGLCRGVLVAAARYRSLQNAHLLSVATPHVAAPRRAVSGASKDTGERQKGFDLSLLDFLVCPLSRKPLRYEEATNELINEDLGIAYPIIDGIPNMIPQDARMIQRETTGPEVKQT